MEFWGSFGEKPAENRASMRRHGHTENISRRGWQLCGVSGGRSGTLNFILKSLIKDMNYQYISAQ